MGNQGRCSVFDGKFSGGADCGAESSVLYTFLAMGIYLVLSEILWEKVAQSSKIQKKTVAVWIGKYIIFNAMFIPVLLIFPTLILAEEAVEKMFWIVLIGAQAGLFVFDKAYMYFQIFIWGKLRSKVMK